MKLECKICGRKLERSVEEYMNHLLNEHNLEFVSRVEGLFFNLLEKE